LSDLARRSVLSLAVLFLMAGVGTHALGFLEVRLTQPELVELLTVGLFIVLFTDGMQADLSQVRSVWAISLRLLGIGLPLTILATAVGAHFLLRLPWIPSFLLGGVLGPTDPAFASALIGREGVPWRLRRSLNVESGLNDGLALPLILALLAVTRGRPEGPGLAVGVLGGLALGVTVAAAGVSLERLPFFDAARDFRRFLIFALGLLTFALAGLTGANAFLAAFAGGATVATLRAAYAQAFFDFGETVADLLKFAGVLVFGTLISLRFLAALSLSAYLFIALALFVARPAAVWLALLGNALPWRQRVVAAWFGPKGFSSVFYAMLVLEAGIPHARFLFHVAAAVIAASMIAHSSTDVLAAKWLSRHPEALPDPAGAPTREGTPGGSEGIEQDPPSPGDRARPRTSPSVHPAPTRADPLQESGNGQG
ncbi:MAG TPA: cation:proton antiporter, partial [Longimicrobiaceae bacterium]|nr:cation:proton antiporter [Longimicrobiaceae bacterium]